MRKVYVFYPSKITGGAEFLLKTVADFLKSHVEIYLVDIYDGWLSLNIENIKILRVEKGSKIHLDEESVLITTANLIRKLDNYFAGDFKVIAWIVQVNNIIPSLPKVGAFQYNPFFQSLLKRTFLRSEYRKINLLSLYLQKNNSLYTMDDACNDVFYKYFGRRINKYLPVVVSEDKFHEISIQKKYSSERFNCVWVGRLDNQFKNPILHHLLFELSIYSRNNQKEIVFDIIGDGPGLVSAKKVAQKIKNIKINFLGEMRGEMLTQTLRSHDIGFAMGTSALEIAACGTPIVLLDASYGVVPKSYKYQWLYESKGYCIGRSIDNALDKTLGNKKSIKDIFNDLILNGDSVRILCHDHVRKFHSIDVLKNKILLAVQETSSNFQVMHSLGLLSKPYWYEFKRFFK